MLAAAVCVRVSKTGLQLLLVQTKESRSSLERWTFPKGHIEPGELASQAAKREASEEAGVKGEVSPDALPRYQFPRADGHPLDVIPFLIDTIQQDDDFESGRSPRWVTPDDAKVLLRLNREQPYTNEHDKVIDRAIEVCRPRLPQPG